MVIGVMIDLFVPDIPEELDLKIKREQFIARQTLNAGGEVAGPNNHTGSADATTNDNSKQFNK